MFSYDICQKQCHYDLASWYIGDALRYPSPRVNKSDRILISTRYTFFSEVHLQITVGLSVLDIEQFRNE
jgi:hypothetical protein